MHRILAETDTAEAAGAAGVPELSGHSGPVSNGVTNGNGHREKQGHLGPKSQSGVVKIHQDRLKIKTVCEFDVIDITGEVERAITECGVREGYALIYSPHTTCAVLVNEKESGLLSDINTTLTRLVPQGAGYLHDDFEIRTENMQEDETKNAHAHLRQVLAGKTSEYIPISGGSLLLGRWQRVMFVEFDCSRDREALIQVCGI